MKKYVRCTTSDNYTQLNRSLKETSECIRKYVDSNLEEAYDWDSLLHEIREAMTAVSKTGHAYIVDEF